MAESWARRLLLCLACKPFPGLCVPELAGDARQWWQLDLCLCSLTERTATASSADWIFDALPILVHGYALLVSNSDMPQPVCTRVE